MNTRIPTRQSIALLGITLALVATSCGAKTNASAQVASLGSTSGTTPTATTTPANTQDALLKYAACMRSNGVNMPDPTFDADGNPTGGGFGRNSGVDRSTPEFQTAQKACGNLLQGVRLGGRGRNFNPQAIQNALNDFTACLRDDGLAVDDITFGRPGGATGANGGATNGSVPGGGGGFGGGFGGPPPGGSAPANGGANGGRGPGGAGFDPTARLIERLGLDNTDPKVIAALAKCQPLITKAFQPPTSTTTATTP